MLTIKQCLWALVLLPSLAWAESWQAQSSEQQLAVLELFTSEGCGLCPAADRWVKKLPEHGINDENLIVLGFHIDYLNDIKGWVDQFSSPVFSDRQRKLAQLNLYQSIYTPEFIVSGEVIHNWEKHVKKVITAVNGFRPEAKIDLLVEQDSEQFIITSQVQVEGEENRQYSKLYLAVIEDNIVNKVTGGDNAGATFNHQNLVRKWLGPIDLNSSGDSELSSTITINKKWDLEQLAVVAIVQNLEDGFVLQGLELPLER